MNRFAWSLSAGYNQAEVLEGISRQLNCAGQTAVDADGNPQHPDDMRSQITLAIAGLMFEIEATAAD